jgi:hypothetical protein
MRAFEVSDSFLVLCRIEVRLDHFFYGSRRVTEISIFREINRAHTAATDATYNLIAAIQNGAGGELLYARTMTARRACFRR